MFNSDIINDGQKEAEKEKPRFTPNIHKVTISNIEFKESKKGSPMFVLDIASDRFQGFKEYVVVDDSETGKKNQIKLAKWFKMAFNYTISSPENALTPKEAGELVCLQLKQFLNMPFHAAILVKEELVLKDDPEKGLIMYVAGKRSIYAVTALNGIIDVNPDRLLWKLKAEEQQKYNAYRAAKEAEYQKAKATKEAQKEEQTSNEATDFPSVDDDLPF